MTGTKVSAATVLEAIKEMNGRQKFAAQPVSMDTLTLVLKVSHAELVPLIEELRTSRDIVYHPPRVASNRMNGTVSLT